MLFNLKSFLLRVDRIVFPPLCFIVHKQRKSWLTFSVRCYKQHFQSTFNTGTSDRQSQFPFRLLHLSVSKQVLLRVRLMQPSSQEYSQLLHLLFVCLSTLSLHVLLPDNLQSNTMNAPGCCFFKNQIYNKTPKQVLCLAFSLHNLSFLFLMVFKKPTYPLEACIRVYRVLPFIVEVMTIINNK